MFEVGGHQCAVHLARVERVVQSLEPQALPGAPEAVMGVVVLQGETVPVFDPLVRFGQKASSVSLSDHLIVVQTEVRKMAIRVQDTKGIISFSPAQLKSVSQVVPELENLAGVAQSPDGTVIVYDVEKFLTPSEEELLARALK